MIGVCIVTYNQEQFIAQAIDSVLSQTIEGHTVRLYIGNDASSDRTREICEEYVQSYPESIVLINNPENLGLVANTLNVLTQIKNDGCEYIAMLDGDDYWCDNQKLYKQISFLEKNEEYGLSYTRVYCLIDSQLIRESESIPPMGDVFQQYGTFGIGNCSVVFRTSLLDLLDFKEILNRKFLSVDYVMYAIFAANSQFSFINDYTAVWRRDKASVSNPQNEAKQIAYLENDKRMWKYLGELYPDRFYFDSSSWDRYYNYRVFNIAFQYRNYPLAHSFASKLGNRPGLTFNVKKLCAKNRVLFYFWNRLKK